MSNCRPDVNEVPVLVSGAGGCRHLNGPGDYTHSGLDIAVPSRDHFCDLVRQCLNCSVLGPRTGTY